MRFEIRVFLIYILVARAVYGLGSEEADVKAVNTEWVFALTSIDVSKAPASIRAVGDVIERTLYQRLRSISSHKRGDEEYGYYESKAWAKARTEAAKKLSDKRAQRDAVIFQGVPEWKYKKSIKAIDEEIKKLEEEFWEVDETAPRIAVETAFKFTQANETGTFPEAPKSGGERRFCVTQKVDAFIGGAVREYHGRVFLNIKVWSLAFDAFIYERDVLFSSEDVSAAIGELSGELIEAVSGYQSARLVVRTDAPGSLVFIGDSLVEEEETLQPPGEASLTVSAEGRSTVTAPIELVEGEGAEVTVALPLITLAPMRIAAFDRTGDVKGALYKGALYVGETPFTLDLPVSMFDYFRIEMEGGVGGLAVFESADEDGFGEKRIRTRLLPDPEKKPVEKARDRMYLSYGLFWMALPIATVVGFPWQGGGGMYGSASSEAKSSPTAANVERANTLSAVSIGAAVAVGLTVVDVVYRMVRYFTIANTNSPVLLK
jgi:hypothetical protein